MAAVARRKDGTIVVTVRITFKPGRDDDLMQLVESAPRGTLAGIIRSSMRGGVSIAEAVEQAFEDVDTSSLGMDI